MAQSTDAEGVTGCKLSAHVWKMNALEDSRRPSANSKICTLYENSAQFYKMNDLRRQSSRPQQTFERWTPRKHELPNELARQSEAKRKQAPQREANVCRRRMQSASAFILSGSPNECWLHTCDACARTIWRLGLRAPLVACTYSYNFADFSLDILTKYILKMIMYTYNLE